MKSSLFLSEKKAFYILFAASCIIFLSGCGNTDTQKNTKKPTQETSLEKQIQKCKESGFIDYTQNMSKEESKTLLSSFRKTSDTKALSQYFCSQNMAWRAYIAENIHTNPQILDFLSDDENEDVRAYLSSNRALPETLTKKLKNDTNKVLYALARNPIVKEETLKEIFQKPASPQVQVSLAYNRGTSEAFQTYLAQKMREVSALEELAKHPNLSPKTKAALQRRDIESVTKKLEEQKN